MALVRGPSQPQQAYSDKVLEGETVVSGGGIATPLCVPIACVLLPLGNWLEDRFLEAEGTDIDPVLRPFAGPEEPLVGATKGLRLHHLVISWLSRAQVCRRFKIGALLLLSIQELCPFAMSVTYKPVSLFSTGRLSYLSHVVTAPHHDRQAKPNTRRCIPVHYPPVSHTSSLLA